MYFLLTISNCSNSRKVWDFYLQTCREHESFFGLTWAHFQQLIENVEKNETYMLNPKASAFVPRRLRLLGIDPSIYTAHQEFIQVITRTLISLCYADVMISRADDVIADVLTTASV